MIIATARYQDKKIDLDKHLPIGTTCYNPRFKVHYKYTMAKAMAPSKELLFGKLKKVAFEKAYKKQLDANKEAIAEKLAELSEQAQGLAKPRKILLLCFCDLTDCTYCHRIALGKWLTLRMGLKVPEFTQPAMAKEVEEDHPGAAIWDR